jgi:hypothetical protein
VTYNDGSTGNCTVTVAASLPAYRMLPIQPPAGTVGKWIKTVDSVTLSASTGTPVFTAERQDGTTEDTSAMISGAATVQGGSALQKFAGGTNGATYLIRAKITTSGGRTLVGGGLLPIKRGAA